MKSMAPFRRQCWSGVLVCCCQALLGVTAIADESSGVGPQTEKRFPPLIVPAGFKATLFACDPLVEYPSVISLGPKLGTVFVAHDYVTGLGYEIVRRDEIRLLKDSDEDGYAEQSTLYADGFNSIQGMAYSDGTVFVMHAPFLTALRDTTGDGVADERRDLLKGLGLTPENNPTRLHCANGVVVGHDGWLYLAIGDNGVDVERLEGDRLVLQGGGILRCRPDGRDLHVFATGLRNIYDIALDDQLNVFVRDNENDGGDYMIRVYHSFHGADHGYPYLYLERPHEALAPLADLGRGSSAGGVCYLETAFPADYQGNLFFCEWGKSVVRYERHFRGSGFAPMKELEFAVAAANDPYGLKPTDIIVDHDGSLLMSDWADGQRPKRGRGRIYRISAVPPATLTAGAATVRAQSPLERLDSPSYLARLEAQAELMRLQPAELDLLVAQSTVGPRAQQHLVWILARQRGRESKERLFEYAQTGDDARLKVQAVRALVDLFDPSLNHDETAKQRAAEIASRMSQLPGLDDPLLRLEVTVALGRLRWRDVTEWLPIHFHQPDARLAHAAAQTLRRSGNWSAVLRWLEEPLDSPLYAIALVAIADQADAQVVDGLISCLSKAPEPRRREQLAELLCRVYKLPGPWTYWGYRPGARPANSVTWERTPAIAAALDRILGDPDHAVRTATLKRMQREQIPVSLATLDLWLADERSAEALQAILDSLAKAAVDESRERLVAMVAQREIPTEVRVNALAMLVGRLDANSESRLLELARTVEDGPIQVNVLNELARRPKIASDDILLMKLDSPAADVRAAAMMASAARGMTQALPWVAPFLKDADPQVRLAGAWAAGPFKAANAASPLKQMAIEGEPTLRAASLTSLRLLGDPGALSAATEALQHPHSQLAAIEYLSEFGRAEYAAALIAAASDSRSHEVLTATARALIAWRNAAPPDSVDRRALSDALAEIQARSGTILYWQVMGPIARESVVDIRQLDRLIESQPADARSMIAIGAESRVDFTASGQAHNLWLAMTDVRWAEPTRLQFLAASNSPLRLVRGDVTIFQRDKPVTFQPDSDRFETQLPAGTSRLVAILNADQASSLQVRFRPLSSSAEHERLTQYLLQNAGNVDRGRELFSNADKSLCLKCHRMGDQGGQIGPNLTGVGDRYSRIHLIESILEPSRAIAPSYETISVELSSGQVASGVRVSEDTATLILGDDKGERREILKSDIEHRNTQRRSTMPDGLEKRFTDREFLDLLAYLVSQKKEGG